jgi:hypothetical protein
MDVFTDAPKNEQAILAIAKELYLEWAKRDGPQAAIARDRALAALAMATEWCNARDEFQGTLPIGAGGEVA